MKPIVVVLTVLLWLPAHSATAQDGPHSIAYSENVPVPGGIEGLAHALGIQPPGRAMLIPEIARYLYRAPDRKDIGGDHRRALLVRHLNTVPSEGPTELVPVPLDAATWSRSILQRPVAPGGLFGAIMSDRRAALMAYGLAWLGDGALEFLSRNPTLLTRLSQRNAEGFAAYGRSLHVDYGRIVVPGGDDAAPLWEAVVGEPITRPDRFIARLFDKQHGRVAYLYDAIASLDEPHARFALGLWMPDRAARRDRFVALAAVSSAAFPEFNAVARPLTRPAVDLPMMLARLSVEPDGTPSTPNGRTLWEHVFEAIDRRDDDLPQTRDLQPGPLIDAAWLAERVLTRDSRERRERLDAISFAQRAFHAAPDRAFRDVLAALGGFARFRTLMLTLDRMNVTDPATYGAAVGRAAALNRLDRRRTFTALAQFQSALAVIAEIRLARVLDATAAERLTQSLISLELSDDGYRCGVAGWIDRTLVPALPQGIGSELSVEERLLAAMSGAGSTATTDAGRLVTWEGQTYRMDLAGAELRRVTRIRSKQGGPTLDQVMAFARDVRALMTLDTKSTTLAALQQLAAAITEHGALFERGKDASDPGSVVSRAVSALGDTTKPEGVARAARLVPPLRALCDHLLADVLMSVAYAMHLGDGEGALLLGGNVARWHDFGSQIASAGVRDRTPWQIPAVQVLPGIPWHVRGSVLGLDVGLSSLALRQVSEARILLRSAGVNDHERKGFSDSLALLNPFDLSDSDRDEIAAALARGRARIRRVEDAPQDIAQVFADVHALHVDGLRQRAIRWALVNEPDSAGRWLSLSEVMALGRPAAGNLDAWGMSALAFESCLCTRLLSLAAWPLFTQQPSVGVLHTRMADLNLRVVEISAELHVPAALARGILAAAVQDYIDEVQPSDFDDWMALVYAAGRFPRERIEDYIAALTSNGTLVPATSGPMENRQ